MKNISYKNNVLIDIEPYIYFMCLFFCVNCVDVLGFIKTVCIQIKDNIIDNLNKDKCD